MPFSLLVLSQSPVSMDRIIEAFGLAGYTPDCQQASDAGALRQYLDGQEPRPELYLVTDELLELAPAEAVTLIRGQAGDVPILVIVEPANEAVGLAAIKAGAADLLYWDRLARLGWVAGRMLGYEKEPSKAEPAREEAAVQSAITDVALEMQTTISMLGLYTHLLKRGRPGQGPEYLRAMEQQIEVLNRLLRSTLGQTGLDRAEPQMDVVPIDWNQVVGATVEIYRPLAEASGLELLFMPGAGLPDFQGQPRQLTQALSNLLLNAIHYTPAGQIEVRTYLHASRSEVCLKVKDTGLGIGREDMAHIFERYYRGRSASQQRILGAGLGLAVAKEIVEAHGGWIDAKSEENVGSVFTIGLPVVLGSEDDLECHILIVENSQLMRSVLQETLEQEGFVVGLAEHGRAALSLLDDFKPDLILSDVAMPEMDGYAFLDAVRARPECKDIPFIFITGQSDQKDYLQSQAARGASFLLKPIVIEELLTAIRARLA
jgi:signal transduction histidine kinase